MAYTITPTNGQNPIVIADGTINTSTTVTLVGKNYPNYGNILDQNFVRLLENSSSTIAPGSPLKGEIWWDSGNNILKVYTGSVWKNVGSTTASVTQPTTNNVGDLWWKTDTGALYGFDINGNYKLIGPQTGLAGITSEVLSDGTSNYNVISFKVSGYYYMILSTQGVSAFQPNPSIDGFQYIYPGLNLISTDYLTNARFAGEATNSEKLGGIYGNAYLRSDINSSTTGTISILNNAGLKVGTANNLNLSVNTPNVAITNTTSLGTMNFKVNSGSTLIDAVDIYPNGNLVCNFDLVVAGTIKSGGSSDFVISTTTPSINTVTGAFQDRGGAGISGNINVGGSQNNFVGNITAGSLNSNASITAAGTSTFTGLSTFNGGFTIGGGLATIGAPSNLKITGGGPQKFLTADATSGICSWQTVVVPTVPADNTAFTNGANYVTASVVNGYLTVSTAASTYAPLSGAAFTGSISTSGNFAATGGINAGQLISGSSASFSSTVATGALTVTGSITATGDITAFSTSDARLKTNVETINNALDKVASLRGITYSWNEMGLSSFDVEPVPPYLMDREVGLIAQEVQEVLPEVVVTRTNGYLAMRYERVVPLLVEAIKELRQQVNELRKVSNDVPKLPTPSDDEQIQAGTGIL